MESIDFDRAPEGSTHYDPVDSNFLLQLPGCSMVWHCGRGWRHHNGQYPDDLSECARIVKLPPKLQKQWDGEGLPPVGTICEVRYEELYGGRPMKAEILKHCTNVDVVDTAFYWIDAPAGEPQLLWGCDCFYPIRTPEQVAMDARRARFEAHVRATPFYSIPEDFDFTKDLDHSDGGYFDASIHGLWLSYNAALDGVEIELPPALEGDLTLVAAIESAGVKVKQ